MRPRKTKRHSAIGTRSTVVTALIVIVSFHSVARQPKPAVVFTSECSCERNHGVSRWRAKTDLAEPPANSIEIQSITPSEIYEWRGPGGNITHGSGRIAAENRWYAITGRLKKVRTEDDGDLHIVLADADDDKPGEVVIEIPLGERWCALRKTVFSWTDAIFPFPTTRAPFRLVQNHVVTAVGKVFYDIDHSGNDTKNNRRDYDNKLAVWEIHPVMQLLTGDSTAGLARPQTQPQVTPQIAAPPPSVAPVPTATPEEFVTITQPVTIQIPYGTTVIPRGMKLPVISRDAQAVRVRYMNEVYAVPVSSTDLR